jgi:hypothetical protein
MRPVSGLPILSLNPSLQMKLTDDYAAGNTDAHKGLVDERYRLVTSTIQRPIVDRSEPLNLLRTNILIAAFTKRDCV